MTFFFLQTTILTLIGPLFTILRRAPEAKSAQGKLYFKGSPLSFFTFSRKHTKPDVPKGSPFEFFDILNGMFVNKSRISPFYIFRHYATSFERKIFFKNFNFFSKKSVLRFLSLRYGADFRRSRLVFFFSLQSHSEWSTFYNLFICSVVHLRLNF